MYYPIHIAIALQIIACLILLSSVHPLIVTYYIFFKELIKAFVVDILKIYFEITIVHFNQIASFLLS